MASGRYADAVPIYRQLVREVPGNIGLIANLAMALHMAGRDAEAVEQFARVLQVNPKAYPALMMSGVSYMRLGQSAKAAPLFEAALKLQPDDLEARRMVADALLMLNRHEAAAAHLRKLTEAAPLEPRGWYGLGQSYERLAQAAYDRMLRQFPESPFTIAVTAEARLRQGRYNSAFALLKRAGDVPGVHAGLAEVYEKTGHADWAAAARAQVRKADCRRRSLACDYEAGKWTSVVAGAKLRQGAEGLFWLVRTYNAMALDAFRQLPRLPASAELHEVLAEIHRNSGRYKEAVASWQDALRLAPGDARLRRELAATLYMAREYPQAEAALREEARSDPKDAVVQFMLGDSILNQQRAADAIPFLRRSVELDPKYLPAHASLARSYGQTGEPAKAILHLEKSLEVDTDGALHYQLARAYQAAGRAGEAKKLLARFQELQQESAADTEITAP
jgi:predicted Zn-dependent protease